METKTASNRMLAIITLFDMHTSFLPKVVDGFSEKDAQNRLNTKANHVAWLTGSLVQGRCEVAGFLGIPLKQAADELFKMHKGIQDDVTYPSLESFKKDWEIVTPPLRTALLTVTDEQLDKRLEIPEMSMSYYDYISFLVYREANCIGQIALWRRLLGYPAMNYMP
ncbi:hypothetical protein CLV51_105134 [Chitinophaga niastensis]|uniref:DinB family protein n=1 Tax=Chitinophaga niastensis TaxID=536980 RepID=A0A2P8HEW2_CHINA|nr:hypothetical protein [Chitinophaga niastensis]PSL44762.1 hypothetical protein CLV51_105134 [Chitinophaga niastensis]